MTMGAGDMTSRANDYSALMLEEWLDEYERERHSFASVSLFCEVKLKEVIELTNKFDVDMNGDDSSADSSSASSAHSNNSSLCRPSKVRTAVCLDLLDMLIACIIQGNDDDYHDAIKQQRRHPSSSSSSRRALGELLLKLRDELVKSIYVPLVAAHMLLQFHPSFNSLTVRTPHPMPMPMPTPTPPLPPSIRMPSIHLNGSQTVRSHTSSIRGRTHMMAVEEKVQWEAKERRASLKDASLTHRPRIHSHAHVHSPDPSIVRVHGVSSGPSTFIPPPSCLPALLQSREWFSLIPSYVTRNRSLAEHARVLMIPSQLFRLRQLQKKVIRTMTSRWRNLLLQWKFFEWRQVVQQRKQDKLFDRGSKIVAKLTSKMATLERRIHMYQWRQLVVYKKYCNMKSSMLRTVELHRDLTSENDQLQDRLFSLRSDISSLDASNHSLESEIDSLKQRLETSHSDLHDSSQHQQQCAEMLEALRHPLKQVFQAILQQIECFQTKEFFHVNPIIQTIVNPEYQSQLEALITSDTNATDHALTMISGQNALTLPMTQGNARQRVAICAEVVARWLALQLKLSGSGDCSSEYLLKSDNQQRIVAALARIRQLCSTSPPAILPPFPFIMPLSHRKGGVTTPGRDSGRSCTPTRAGPPAWTRTKSRTRTMFVGNHTADPKNKEGKEDEKDDVESNKSPSARARGIRRKGLQPSKLDDLTAAAAAVEASKKRLLEGQAIPPGTMSTPQRVFSSLRDTDRPETVFSAAAVLMQADREIGKSLRMQAEDKLNADEHDQLAALKTLIQTLRISADMTSAEMDSATHNLAFAVETTQHAMSRTRMAQARMQAIEDEVFAQSVKLLHQHSQRKHNKQEKEKEKERETIIPTDTLEFEPSLYPDVLDSPLPKSDIIDTNKILDEFTKDLFKIFVYYCYTTPTVGTAGAGSAAAVAAATLAEPRMGNAEFCKFVRECKLKLQQTNMIDSIFIHITERDHVNADHSASADPSTPSADNSASESTLSRAATPLTAATVSQLLSSMATGVSLVESEHASVARRHGESKTINFKQFGETLVRLSLLKYASEKSMPRKLRALITQHVLPAANTKATLFYKQQAAAVAASTSVGVGLGIGGVSSAPVGSIGVIGGVGVAGTSLYNVEVDAVFRKHHKLLTQIFQIYARITPLFMTMTFNDFLGFTRDFELLHKYVTQHDLKLLFGCVVKETAAANAITFDGSDPAILPSHDKNRVMYGDASGRSGSDHDGSEDMHVPVGGSSSGAMASSGDGSSSKDLSYHQFLEMLAAVSHYVIRNPYYAVHDRVEKFIVCVLASRKKLPTKVYRSAV